MLLSNLATYTILPTDYNYDEIYNYVNIAELEYIVPLVGIDKYNEWSSKQNTPEIVQQYLGMQVSQLILPIAAIKVTDKGLTRNNSEYSTKASLEEISYLETRINSVIGILYKQMVSYLKENNLLIKQPPLKNQIETFPPINTNIR